MRETVHIVSHSHWDREWYLSWEDHRMRLVELFDDLFELFESDPEFKSFHLDGQTIVLDDYLEIRPQERARLQRYIEDGRLVVGPFYILQDDFLISSEANIRNTLIGHVESQKWGEPPKIGYFPDTFGNMGQTPQLLHQAGMDVAFFGRGVKPVGFANEVPSDEYFQSSYSEMIWEGADGTPILGILFANWYSNGNEIPVDLEEARAFWEKKLEDVRKYASTSHYLLMNGCDHQPVQKNLSQALAIARQLYPDITFVHSTLEDYVEAVRAELPNNLSCVKGELTSQETDGWYTLTNTASSRIYLKQAFDQASHLLEQVVEPLVVLTRDEVPRDELRYAWKLLLQNAPHDSICGCSIDSVHTEMETRLQKVHQVGNFLTQRSLERWEKKLNSHRIQGLAFSVLNPSPYNQSQVLDVELIVDAADFRDGNLETHYQAMEKIELPPLGLYRSQDQELEAQIEDLGVAFTYDLPKDAFRTPMFARRIRVRFALENQAPFSWQTFQVLPKKEKKSQKEDEKTIENCYYRLEVVDGDLILEDKESGKRYKNWMYFEDSGDVGNEYVFRAPEGEEPLKSQLLDFQVLYRDQTYTQARTIHQLILPLGMDDRLGDEQRRLVEFKNRKSRRNRQVKELFLETTITFFRNSPQIRFQTHFKNEMKDHRLRLVFDLGIHSGEHEADSIFEVVKRSNQTSAMWENPSNCQRHRTFISLADSQSFYTVSSKGLHEYEVIDSSKVALTLLRAVGEMGDWGYFPTPDAQCLRDWQVEYTLELGQLDQRYDSYQRAFAFQGTCLTKQLTKHSGSLPLEWQCLEHPALDNSRIAVTSLKVAEASDQILLRYYNLSQELIDLGQDDGEWTDLLEESLIGEFGLLQPQEIRTQIVGKHRRGDCYGCCKF